MEPLIVVDNHVDCKCVRHVHLMSNLECGLDALRPYGSTNWVVSKEAGAWHYRADFAWRGMLDIACVGSEMRFRRLVVWNLTPPPAPPHSDGTNGEGRYTVRSAIAEAADHFFWMFHFRPGYAFMKKLPAGVENGTAITLTPTLTPGPSPEGRGGCDLYLFEAEWMLERCVAVGGR